MIDNADQVERLLAKLQAVLPVPARITPELAATLLDGAHAATIKSACAVTWISYAGDEGGIMCRLTFDDESENAVFTSITHLRFDPRLPFAREIAAYQKHRVKRLRRCNHGFIRRPTAAVHRANTTTLTRNHVTARGISESARP